jgi:hypothetical protein
VWVIPAYLGIIERPIIRPVSPPAIIKPEHSPVNPRKICSNISASDPADNKRSFRVTVRQSVIVKHRTDISVICIMAEI